MKERDAEVVFRVSEITKATGEEVWGAPRYLHMLYNDF